MESLRQMAAALGLVCTDLRERLRRGADVGGLRTRMMVAIGLAQEVGEELGQMQRELTARDAAVRLIERARRSGRDRTRPVE